MYDNKNKINRSNSESDLNISHFDKLSVSSPSDSTIGFVRRIYVEEIISADKNYFSTMRSSYRELLDEAQSSSKLIKIKNEAFISGENSRNVRTEDTPMEVDISYDERFPKMVGAEYINKSLKKSVVVESNRSETNIPLERKARVIHINPVKNKETETRRLWLIPTILIIPIIPIIFSYLFINYSYIFVNSDIQVENIKNDLMKNVHGHKPLVESIVYMLENRQNWENMNKLLVFVGSQGVGKTFTANLFKKHFSSNLVHDLYGSQLYYETEKQKILDGIKSCCLNLLIIDDLNQSDNDELFFFIQSLPKNSFILVIVIYNIHYSDNNMNTILNKENIVTIRDSFDIAGIKNYELFVFEDFTQEQIKDWMKKQMESKNVSSDVEDQILQNVLDTHNVEHGLKGLHSKLIMELEKYRK